MNNDVWLKQVELKNFQSHSHTVVDFTDGFNILAGSSNAGKSAVMRAIIWNILNEPSGDEFIRKGQTEAVVTTHWSNGFSIERSRNKSGSKNFYVLYKDGEKISEYTGFGTGVPPEIVEAHGITPLANGVYFNYANQLETAFMLSNTPKVRAETIGNLEELGRIDEELNKVNTDIRMNQKARKELDKEINEMEKRIELLEKKVEQKSQKIETLSILKTGIQEKTRVLSVVQSSSERLNDIHAELKQYKEVIDKAAKITNAWNEQLPENILLIKQMDESVTRLYAIRKELEGLNFINTEALAKLESLIGNVNDSVATYQHLLQSGRRLEDIKGQRIKTAEGISNRVASIDYSSVDKDVEKFRILFQEAKRLSAIKQDIQRNQEIVAGATKEIEVQLDKFIEALQEANVCPTCSQETDKVTATDIQKII